MNTGRAVFKIIPAVFSLIFLLSLFAVSAEPERMERTVTARHFPSTASCRPKWTSSGWTAQAAATASSADCRKPLPPTPRHVEFMMNGGIFEGDGVPSGLLVIDGKTVRPLNKSDGSGNFYLKPNGVFYVDATGAHIVSTGRIRIGKTNATHSDPIRAAFAPAGAHPSGLSRGFHQSASSERRRHPEGWTGDFCLYRVWTKKISEPLRVCGFLPLSRLQRCALSRWRPFANGGQSKRGHPTR